MERQWGGGAQVSGQSSDHIGGIRVDQMTECDRLITVRS